MGMIADKYLPPIKYLGGAIGIVLLIGLVIYPILSAGFSEEVRSEVLISSIPFVSIFVSILLGYILFMFLFALRFNHKIPYRTFRFIELTIMAGIVVGVITLFQPIRLVAYQFGFLWLLVSTLLFIMWSHVIPQSQDEGLYLAPFTSRQQLIGLVAGAVVAILIVLSFTSMTRPEEPYGYSQRQWERGLRDEQKQEIIEEAESTYQFFTIPYFIVMSLLPGAFVFFSVREIVASQDAPPMKKYDTTNYATASC